MTTLSKEERDLLWRIASCGQISEALKSESHPCRGVVDSQRPRTGLDLQVPEGWAGNLGAARVVFVSSNPSISEGPSELAERYPTRRCSEEEVVQFLGRRFDQTLDPPHVNAELRHRQNNGEFAPHPTRFWVGVKALAVELLGGEADPARNYVMTEVVHCKSKKELGVDAAVETCGTRYLNEILRLCPAKVVIVVGTKAQRRMARVVPEIAAEDQRNYIITARLGDHERTIAFVWHPTSMIRAELKTIAGLYGVEGLAKLQRAL